MFKGKVYTIRAMDCLNDQLLFSTIRLHAVILVNELRNITNKHRCIVDRLAMFENRNIRGE